MQDDTENKMNNHVETKSLLENKVTDYYTKYQQERQLCRIKITMVNALNMFKYSSEELNTINYNEFGKDIFDPCQELREK